jgi:hypothetical protein
MPYGRCVFGWPGLRQIYYIAGDDFPANKFGWRANAGVAAAQWNCTAAWLIQ